MTDLEKLKACFDEIGQVYEEEIYKEASQVRRNGEMSCNYNAIIGIENGIGFYGFYCDFYFLDGVLVGHGVWE